MPETPTSYFPEFCERFAKLEYTFPHFIPNIQVGYNFHVDRCGSFIHGRMFQETSRPENTINQASKTEKQKKHAM